MAGSGFQVYKRAAAGSDPIEKIKSLPSQQYTPGAMLTTIPGTGTNGVANLVAVADKGTHIYESMITPDSLSAPAVADKSTALSETILATPVNGSRVILKSYLTGDAVPPINGVACNSNASLTTLKVTAAGSTNDYVGGTCYVPELGQQRLITVDSVSTGVHTFTVDPAFTVAPTTGHTVVAVPWSKGSTAVKFNATSPSQCIGTAVADKSGGQNKIEDVDLKGDNLGAFVLTSLPALS